MSGIRPIAPFHAMEMAREAGRLVSAGASIVRFDVGQPQWSPPPAALLAARTALDNGGFGLGYTDSLGDRRLRDALSAWYAAEYGLDVPAARIAITTGASGAFQLAFLALLAEGDGVLMARPGYPPYRHIVSALGFTPHDVAADAHDGFQLTSALAASAPHCAAALIASPANPTGAILDHAAFGALSAALRARGTTLISDEIYHGLDPANRAVCALSIDPNALVINSFSKRWAMTGWRVGWLVAPLHLMGRIEALAQNLTICPPAIAQTAALAALTETAWTRARDADITANRTALLQALPALKLAPVTMPDGAFYMLVDVSAHSSDSVAFCNTALHEAGVAMTPGIDFDAVRGRAWVRLSFARDAGEVALGIARLRTWLTA